MLAVLVSKWSSCQMHWEHGGEGSSLHRECGSRNSFPYSWHVPCGAKTGGVALSSAVQTTQHILKSGTSKDGLVMQLVRSWFFMVQFSLSIKSEHVAGKQNRAADNLSRDGLPLFFRQVPKAEHLSTPILAELLKALATHRPNWMSPAWSSLLSSFSQRD